jgi:hypothetical protein
MTLGTERTRQEKASVFLTHNPNGWPIAFERRLLAVPSTFCARHKSGLGKEIYDY